MSGPARFFKSHEDGHKLYQGEWNDDPDGKAETFAGKCVGFTKDRELAMRWRSSDDSVEDVATDLILERLGKTRKDLAYEDELTVTTSQGAGTMVDLLP